MENIYGKIIVITGLDGVGKTTQMDLLENKLKDLGVKYYRTKYPRYGTESGNMITRYLSGDLGIDNPNPLYISSLYLNDMYEDYTKNWKSLYESGYVILMDRYFESSLMYQGNNIEFQSSTINRRRYSSNHRGTTHDTVGSIETMIQQLELPAIDYLIYLDAIEETRLRYLSDRGGDLDVLEKDLPLQRRIRDFSDTYFPRCAKRHRHSVVKDFKLIKVDEIDAKLCT
ncbi:MAG: dTMP kinase, partial [Paraclostridium sp.]